MRKISTVSFTISTRGKINWTNGVKKYKILKFFTKRESKNTTETELVDLNEFEAKDKYENIRFIDDMTPTPTTTRFTFSEVVNTVSENQSNSTSE